MTATVGGRPHVRPDRPAPAGARVASARTRGRSQRLLDTVLGGLGALLVLPTLLPLFAGGGAGWLLAAAAIPLAVAGATVAAGGDASTGTPDPADPAPSAGRFPVGPWARVAADVVGVVVVVALVPADAQGRGALTGLASGGARLVTAALPVVPAGPELGAVMVALALATGVGAELGLRARAPLAPTLAPLVLYAAALAVGAGGQPAPTWDAVVVVAGAAVIALLRRLAPLARADTGPSGPAVAGARRARSPVPWQGLAAGVALAAVAGAVAVPLGDVLPGSSTASRYDLRTVLRPAVPPPPGINPLVDYGAIYDGPVKPTMAVQVTGADPTSLYWRLDVLDHFDGTGWTSTAPLLPAGTTLPPGPAEPVPTDAASAEVHLEGPTVYLPTPYRPTSVSVAGLLVDPTNGVLAVGSGGAQPGAYRLRVALPAPTEQQLRAATAAPGGDPGGAAPSDAVDNAAARVVAGVPATPFARLTAIQRFLTGPGFTHHPPGDSPLGSGNFQVAQLLQSRDGSAEQYAAAFALLARAVGFDARIAIGYHGGSPGKAAGTASFTTRDLTVWPEVLLEGIGWEPFPAVPSGGGAPQARPTPAPSSPLSQALNQQATANAAGNPPATVTRPAPHAPPAHHGGASGLWVVVPVVVIGLLAAAVAAVVLVKGVRRRRQERQADPGLRIDGAWECVLDRLTEYGVELVPSLTVPEVVERAAASCGPERVGPLPDLVSVVDARRYNRRLPPSPTAADLAWTRTVEVEAALRRGVRLRRRVRAVLSPAPFLRR